MTTCGTARPACPRPAVLASAGIDRQASPSAAHLLLASWTAALYGAEAFAAYSAVLGSYCAQAAPTYPAWRTHALYCLAREADSGGGLSSPLAASMTRSCPSLDAVPNCCCHSHTRQAR